MLELDCFVCYPVLAILFLLYWSSLGLRQALYVLVLEWSFLSDPTSLSSFNSALNLWYVLWEIVFYSFPRSRGPSIMLIYSLRPRTVCCSSPRCRGFFSFTALPLTMSLTCALQYKHLLHFSNYTRYFSYLILITQFRNMGFTIPFLWMRETEA